MALLTAVPALAQWPQFALDPQHRGNVAVKGQPLLRVLADVTYDPFVDFEQASTGGDLDVHYQTPLVDGDDVFMEFKSGTFTGAVLWQSQNWSIHRLHWENGKLVDKWTAPSDWKPVPAESSESWEPVFHALLANGYLYMPGFGGTLLQIDRSSGAQVRRINPFSSIDFATFVAGALSSDANGNIYYTAVQLDANDPWGNDVHGAWLVRVAPDGTTKLATLSSIVTGAPRATDRCSGQFDLTQQPLPPSPNAIVPTTPCGSQRPAMNAAPAVGADGTIYIVTRAHFNNYWGWLVAVNPDLTPKWAASMRNRFRDGCNVLLPPNGTSGGCRAGTATGVDPEDNQLGSGRVFDSSSSSPVVAPDGTILYGAASAYNDDQGHLMQFGADGTFLRSYTFGWDITPAIWQHDRTYSIVLKENHYGGVVHPTPAFFITQLDPQFNVEWQVKNTNTNACGRAPNGSITCIGGQTNGFEWCVNAPAIDSAGTVYVNSEDGNLYQIAQGGTVQATMFLQLALGAGYTPLAIGPDGRIYAQNAGHLFAVGSVPRSRVVHH